MDKLMIAQTEAPVNGPEWDTEAGEYVVYLDGVNVGYAGEYGAAWALYSLALTTRRDHYTRSQNRVDLERAI